MILLWAGFVAFILVMLGLDLFVVNRNPHVIKAKEAMAWTGVCVVLALAFTGAVYFIYANDWLGIASKFLAEHASDPRFNNPDLADPTGHAIGIKAALEFFTGWLIEYSLSHDNIFIIAVIFAHFRVPLQHQHRVLFWGILGALVLRASMILLGAAAISRWEWVM